LLASKLAISVKKRKALKVKKKKKKKKKHAEGLKQRKSKCFRD